MNVKAIVCGIFGAICGAALCLVLSGMVSAQVSDKTESNVQPELVLQIGHSTQVKALCFSPDGKTFASGDESGEIRLWNPQTGEVKRVLTTEAGAILRLAFSLDGKTIAAGTSAGRISVWRLAADTELFSLEAGVTGANTFVFSLDGKTLLAGGPLRIWDAQSGVLQKTLDGGLSNVVFTPDRMALAEVVMEANPPEGPKGAIYFYSLATTERKKLFQVNSPTTIVLAFSLDGKLLASGGKEQAVQLREVETGRLLHVLSNDKDTVSDLAFVPGNKLLFGWLARAENLSATGVLWDLETGKIKTTVELERGVSNLAISAAGGLLATVGKDSVAFHNLETGKHIRTLVNAFGVVPSNTEPLTAADLSVPLLSYTIFDAQNIIARSGFTPPSSKVRQTRGLLLIDTQTEKVRFNLSRPGVELGHIVRTRDGQQLRTTSYDHKVYIWDAATGKYLREQAESQTDDASNAPLTVVSPDGTLIALSERVTLPAAIRPTPRRRVRQTPRAQQQITSTPNTIRVIDAAQKTLKYVLQGIAVTARANVWFSPNSRWLVGWPEPQQQLGRNPSAPAQEQTEKTTFFLWDAQTGQLKNSLPLIRPLFAKVEFSDDSKFVAFLESEALNIVELQTGQLIQRISSSSGTAEERELDGFAFSPDNSYIAGAYNLDEGAEVRLWSLKTGQVVQTLRDDERCGCVPALSFSPDGRYLAGSSAGSSVFWELQTGRIHRLNRGYNPAADHKMLWFSADSKTIAVPVGGLISGDGLRIYETASGRLLKTILILQTLEGNQPASVWLAFTPEGFYTGSPKAERLIRWRVGEDLFPAEKFAERFHRLP